MDREKIELQKQEVEDQIEIIDLKVEEYLLADRRFEKVFLANGVLVLVFLVITFQVTQGGANPKVVAVLFGTACFQLLVGAIFALFLLTKRRLSKSLYSLGVLIHGVGGTAIFFLASLASILN